MSQMNKLDSGDVLEFEGGNTGIRVIRDTKKSCEQKATT